MQSICRSITQMTYDGKPPLLEAKGISPLQKLLLNQHAQSYRFWTIALYKLSHSNNNNTACIYLFKILYIFQARQINILQQLTKTMKSQISDLKALQPVHRDSIRCTISQIRKHYFAIEASPPDDSRMFLCSSSIWSSVILTILFWFSISMHFISSDRPSRLQSISVNSFLQDNLLTTVDSWHVHWVRSFSASAIKHSTTFSQKAYINYTVVS